MLTKTEHVISYHGEEPPHIVQVDTRLADLQTMVGGLIEVVGLPGGLILVCNEEGKLRRLPIIHSAKLLRGKEEPIAGNFFICRTDGDAFASVLPGDLHFVQRIVRRLR